MKLADFFAGVVSTVTKEAAVVLADVTGVFTTAKTVVAAAPLPANIKNDLTQTLNDAQADVTSVAGLAGTLVGSAIAAGVGDLTTLFYNTAGAISGSKSPSEFSAAEKTVLAQSWTAIRAQGDTLLAQFMAGADPVAQQAANAAAAQKAPNPS